jgi:hypothetical protein
VTCQPPAFAAVLTTTTLEIGAPPAVCTVTLNSCQVRVMSTGAMRSQQPLSISR